MWSYQDINKIPIYLSLSFSLKLAVCFWCCSNI